MDIDAIVKIGALVVALLAMPKIWREMEGLRLSHRRNAFDLAKELTYAVKEAKHPLLVEIGYRSLFKGPRIGAPEIVYLLSMPRPSRALDLFSRGHGFLKFLDGVPDGEPRVGYRRHYRTSKSRSINYIGYLILYLASFLVAVLSLYNFNRIFGDLNFFSALMASVTSLAFLFVAFASVRESTNLLAAISFMEMQRKTV